MATTITDLEVPLSELPATKQISEYHLMWRAFRRDPLAVISLIILLIFILGAIFAPYLTAYPEQGLGDPNIMEKFTAPAWEHPLGTDYLGRDVLARILYGGRSSLAIGFMVVFLAVIVGVPRIPTSLVGYRPCCRART